MYHKLDTVVVESTELDENSEVVKAAARLAGVSIHAVLSHYRRMSRTQFETRLHPSGFTGVSLGRVELPVMNRGVVRPDGWRAATLGDDAVVPKLRPGQVAVSIPEEMTAEARREASESATWQRKSDVEVLRQFFGAVPETAGDGGDEG